MKDYSVSTAGIYRTVDLTGRETTSVVSGYTRSLSVSGFGPGNFRDATPGTFLHTRVKPWHGMWRYSKFGQNAFGMLRVETANSGSIGSQNPYTYDWATLLKEAESKMYDQIRETVDLSVSVAEAGQVTRMLRSAGKLVEVVRRIHPKRWSANWLEYQYGWRPLVNDMYNCLEQLRNGHVTGEHRIIARVRKAGEKVNTINTPLTQFNTQQRDVFSYRCQLITDWRLDDSAINHLANLSSLNPASIAWELVPFSFVVDWVYDVGDYLRASENFLLYRNQFVRGCRTDSALLSSQASFTGKDDLYSTVDLRASNSTGFKRRTSWAPSWPTRPKFKVSLGWQRVLSAASLIDVHIRGRS